MKKVVWTLECWAEQRPRNGAGYERAGADSAALLRRAPPRFRRARQGAHRERAQINEAVAKGTRPPSPRSSQPDGASLDGTGFHEDVRLLGMFDQVKVKTWKISDEKVISVDPNTAIVTYKWGRLGHVPGKPFPTNVFASTVWTKKGDKWLAVFHQESEVAKAAPAPKPPVKK